MNKYHTKEGSFSDQKAYEGWPASLVIVKCKLKPECDVITHTLGFGILKDLSIPCFGRNMEQLELLYPGVRAESSQYYFVTPSTWAHSRTSGFTGMDAVLVF